MKRTKAFLKQLPEFFLILSVFFYWGSSAVVFNPIAITLLIFLILQLIFQNQVVGIGIASLLIAGSLFMLAALMSEFSEFPTFNADAQKLLFVGLTYFISTIIVSGVMIYKYTSLGESSKQITISSN